MTINGCHDHIWQRNAEVGMDGAGGSVIAGQNLESKVPDEAIDGFSYGVNS